MNMPTRFSEFSAAAADYASNYAVGSPMWMNFYNEKFAELIMRECMKEALAQPALKPQDFIENKREV